MLQAGARPGPDLAQRVVPHNSVGGFDLRVFDCEKSFSFLNLGVPLSGGAAGLADGQLEGYVLRLVSVVDAADFQHDPVVVDDVPRRVGKDPVLPLDVVTVGYVAHVGGYVPGVNAGLEEGAGHLEVAPVLPRDEAELHLYA